MDGGDCAKNGGARQKEDDIGRKQQKVRSKKGAGEQDRTFGAPETKKAADRESEKKSLKKTFEK